MSDKMKIAAPAFLRCDRIKGCSSFWLLKFRFICKHSVRLINFSIVPRFLPSFSYLLLVSYRCDLWIIFYEFIVNQGRLSVASFHLQSKKSVFIPNSVLFFPLPSSQRFIFLIIKIVGFSLVSELCRACVWWKADVAMGNIYTVGPNEALVVSGKCFWKPSYSRQFQLCISLILTYSVRIGLWPSEVQHGRISHVHFVVRTSIGTPSRAFNDQFLTDHYLYL